MHADKLKAKAEEAIRERVFPGCVIGVSRNGAREIISAGKFTYEADSRHVTADTIYDLASITKSIPTASLAAIFASSERINLSDTVKEYIPELQNDFAATIEDLLRYRVRGARMSTLGFRTFEQLRTHIFENGFSSPPGKSEYTNLPAYVLGVILERVGGGSLAALAHHYLFKPLELESTTFFPATSHCAPTEIQHGETIQGKPHDESARIFAGFRRSVGHAGLFSSVPDLLKFAEYMLDNYGHPMSIVESAEAGLGWAVHEQWFMGDQAGERTFGKTGFTGTSIVADPEKKTALVILSNRTYPMRPPDATSFTSAINVFRKDIADIVFA